MGFLSFGDLNFWVKSPKPKKIKQPKREAPLGIGAAIKQRNKTISDIDAEIMKQYK